MKRAFIIAMISRAMLIARRISRNKIFEIAQDSYTRVCA